MRGTSEVSEYRTKAGIALRLALPLWPALAAAWLSGCTEFSHFGQISDRESAFSVNDVKIEQQKPGGAWKTLGYTDGKGKWNIFRMHIGGGGKVRFSKPGYATFQRSKVMTTNQSNDLNVSLERS
jgi:hypothetical protein